jgi:hypothetical protein
VSQWLTGGGYSTSQAIVDATSVMSFGDVLLPEAQTTLWGYSLVPVEIEPAVFDAMCDAQICRAIIDGDVLNLAPDLYLRDFVAGIPAIRTPGRFPPARM